MLKLVVIACLAAAVVATPSKSFVTSVNSDEWCHEHHLGSGAASCVKHNGCCFSDYVADIFDNTQDLGPCHSCTAHQNEWCSIYGGDSTSSCLKLGGCTYNSETEVCESAQPEATSQMRLCLDDAVDGDSITAYGECCEAAEAAGVDIRLSQVVGGCAELYFYLPSCAVEGAGKFFEASQADQDGVGMDGYFCVDKNGHELPDTRKETELKIWNIDCEKARKDSIGYQCPNAITLTTKGGVVIVNEDATTDDCSVTCNTDADCAGEDWCCFNGCGYSCQLPVKPMSGCAEVPANEFQTVAGVGGEEAANHHGVEILLQCLEGFNVIPVDAPQDLMLTCKHGHWQTLDGERDFADSVNCQKSCEYYRVSGPSTVDARDLRERDYIVTGSDFFHSAQVTITCPQGYGVIAGTNRAKAESKETLTCEEGEWLNDFDTAQTLECGTCYDAYEFEWRDANGRDCTHYAARPMECNENEGAPENCRVSCRSCLQAEEAWKVRNTVENLNDIPTDNRGNWNRVRELVPVTYQRATEVRSMVEVTHSLPMNEVCTDGAGSNIRKPEGGCPEGYVAMA